METTKKEIVEYIEKSSTNPFVFTLEIPVLENLREEQQGQYYEVTPYTKVFACSKRRKILANLSTKASHLLLWIIMDIRSGKDVIIINKKRYEEESGLTLPTIRSAIKELIEKGLLAFTVYKDTYYINPMFFFKGSRPKKYPENLVITRNRDEARGIKKELEEE